MPLSAAPFSVRAVDRSTSDGKTDPNADAKDAAERRLQRRIRQELDRQYTALDDHLMQQLTLPGSEYWDEAEKELREILEPELREGAYDSAQTNSDRIPIEMNWNTVSAEVLAWSEQYGFDLVSGINDTTVQVLQRALTDYAANPTTIGELVESIKPAFSDFRAQRIAVTEVTRAYSQGMQILQGVADDRGFNMRSVWHTNKDELVCPLCGPMDGTLITDGVYPPLHPNCRCWVTLEWQR